jgi:hypothetical protein
MENKNKPRYLAKFTGRRILHDSPCIGVWEYGERQIFRLGPYQTRGRAVLEMNTVKEKEYVSYEFESSIDDIVLLPKDYDVWHCSMTSLNATLEHDICEVAKIGWKEFWPWGNDPYEIFSEASEKIAACYDELKKYILANSCGVRMDSNGSLTAMLDNDCLVTISLQSIESHRYDLRTDTISQREENRANFYRFIGDDMLQSFFRLYAIRSSNELYSRPGLTINLLHDTIHDFVNKEKLI